MSDSPDELERRLALLERKLEREKKARQLAEKQLEEYSREIYYTNQSLKKSLLQAQKKKQEVEFLGQAASAVASELPLSELFSNTVELTGRFIQARAGVFLFTDGEQVQKKDSAQIFNELHGWHDNAAVLDILLRAIPNEYAHLDLEQWMLTPVEEQDELFETGAKWLIYVNFPLSESRKGWLVFLSGAEYLDEEALFVLDTARGHLTSGISRRLSDGEIRRRNRQLQNTVEQLQQTKRQLIHSEKMASLGQMASGVAHEINNPIGYTRSNTEILSEHLAELNKFLDAVENGADQPSGLSNQTLADLQQSHDIDYIKEDIRELIAANLNGLDRVTEIVDGLRSFSHTSDALDQEVSLAECLTQALKVTWNRLKYNYTVENSVPDDLPLIRGNAGQVQQVLINLIVNAVQAMENGGVLRFEAELTDEAIDITVADSGMGMDEQTQQNLFTPFFTTKPVGEGTGLGLSISYAILEAHNADINVESTPGVGTRFTLSFPRVPS